MFDRQTMTRLAGVLALAATPAAAYAADAADGGKGDGPNPVAVQWAPLVATFVVFGATFIILAKFVWPKLVAGLEEREKKIREEIFKAEAARKSAEEALKNYEKSLAEARAESQSMIEEAKAEQARRLADEKVRFEAEMSSQRESALRSIEAAKRAALNELYAEAASLATKTAEKILQREVNESDQQRLVEETIQEVTKSFAEPAGAGGQG